MTDEGPDIDINAAIDEQQIAQQREIAERMLPDGVTLDSEIFIVFEEEPGQVRIIAELGDAKIVATYSGDYGSNQMDILAASFPQCLGNARDAMAEAAANAEANTEEQK